MTQITQVSARELADMLSGPQPPCVLDVREDWERALASIPGSLHIPLQQIPLRLKELDVSKTIIAMCKAGGRSQMAAEYLRAHGCQHIGNLSGGIDAWAREVDPQMTTY